MLSTPPTKKKVNNETLSQEQDYRLTDRHTDKVNYKQQLSNFSPTSSHFCECLRFWPAPIKAYSGIINLYSYNMNSTKIKTEMFTSNLVTKQNSNIDQTQYNVILGLLIIYHSLQTIKLSPERFFNYTVSRMVYEARHQV